MRTQLIPGTCTILAAAILGGAISSCGPSGRQAYNRTLDLAARDTTVSPANDFFDYANGSWLKKAVIPADKTAWGTFNIMLDTVANRLKTILDSCSELKDPAKGSPARQIGDLYASQMDSTAIEQAGLSPLRRSLDQIDSVASVGDIIRVISVDEMEGYGAPAPFGRAVYPDEKNSLTERLHFFQGGMGLPAKKYYFPTDSAGKAVMASYRELITTLLTLSGETAAGAEKHTGEIIALETKMAAASKTPVELRDPVANYHPMTVGEMDRLAPRLKASFILSAYGVTVDTVVIGQPEFFKSLSGLLATVPVPVWKEYLKFHLIDGWNNALSSPFFDARFKFSQALTGRKTPKPRWRRACEMVDRNLGDALGKLYVEDYFPAPAKAYMEHMVDNIRAAFARHIQALDWMSDSTKAKALDKLAAIVKKIGYPDKWKDYSSIAIGRKSVVENLRHIDVWRTRYEFNKLGKPVDRSEWFMTPPTVNAYYNPLMNDINFPAGILSPPFYFQNGDDAVNYGAIGLVIGHEMTHGFDDQGSKFDKYGNMKNWWTAADKKKFDAHAALIVSQYDDYVVQDSVYLNGKLTEGENIADNGGLAIAYTAFQMTPEAHKDTLIDGLTPDQRFFLAAAQVWKGKVRPELERTWINTDPHSPGKYRVIGPMSNMPAFYRAFHVKPGDGMYRPDSTRVKIW